MSRTRPRRNRPPKAITPMTARDANIKPGEASRISLDDRTAAHLKEMLERFSRPVRRRRLAVQPEQQEA